MSHIDEQVEFSMAKISSKANELQVKIHVDERVAGELKFSFDGEAEKVEQMKSFIHDNAPVGVLISYV